MVPATVSSSVLLVCRISEKPLLDNYRYCRIVARLGVLKASCLWQGRLLENIHARLVRVVTYVDPINIWCPVLVCTAHLEACAVESGAVTPRKKSGVIPQSYHGNHFFGIVEHHITGRRQMPVLRAVPPAVGGEAVIPRLQR